MTSALRPKKAKTIQDIRILESLVEQKKTLFGKFISPNELLNMQILSRLDLIVRDLAIGHLLGENTVGLGLWKKLGARTRMDYQTRVIKLQHLMKSFKKYGGYLTKYPLPVNGNCQLLGGAHRFVLSKRYNILEVPICGVVTDKRLKGNYTIPVMKKLGYTTEEMEYILGLKDEFYGIT